MERGDLTDQQKEAIHHKGSPLLIIAGTGSGKTEVLAWRVAHLIKYDGIQYDKLLVTTFTDKAAIEPKDRIQKKAPDIGVEVCSLNSNF